jgi:hypothetical protein
VIDLLQNFGILKGHIAMGAIIGVNHDNARATTNEFVFEIIENSGRDVRVVFHVFIVFLIISII